MGKVKKDFKNSILCCYVSSLAGPSCSKVDKHQSRLGVILLEP